MPNGSWNGMVGMLAAGEAEICAAGLTITSERSEVLTFLHPVQRDVNAVWGQRPTGQAMNYWAFVDIFTGYAWLVMGIAIVALTTLRFLIAVERSANVNSFFDALGMVLNSALLLDYNVQTTRGAQKVLIWFTRVTFFLVFAFYSGLLTSTMTFTPPSTLKSFQVS